MLMDSINVALLFKSCISGTSMAMSIGDTLLTPESSVMSSKFMLDKSSSMSTLLTLDTLDTSDAFS